MLGCGQNFIFLLLEMVMLYESLTFAGCGQKFEAHACEYLRYLVPSLDNVRDCLFPTSLVKLK